MKTVKGELSNEGIPEKTVMTRIWSHASDIFSQNYNLYKLFRYKSYPIDERLSTYTLGIFAYPLEKVHLGKMAIEAIA